MGTDPSDAGTAMVGRLVDAVESAYARASAEAVEARRRHLHCVL